jgi:hypothetical protein
MLLLGGFAGIGFMAYRRKSKAASNGRLILNRSCLRAAFFWDASVGGRLFWSGVIRDVWVWQIVLKNT